MRTKHLRRGGLAAATVATTAIALLALGTGGSVGAAQVGSTATAPADSLALLRQAPGDRDRIGPADQRWLAPLAADRHLDLAGSRLGPYDTPGAPVRVIPGAGVDAVCVALPDPVDGAAVRCTTVAEAQHGQLWTGLVGLPGQQVGDARIAVVVPDGVSSIDTIDERGVRTKQPAQGNVVVADVHDAAAYELTVDGTLVHQPIGGTPKELVRP